MNRSEVHAIHSLRAGRRPGPQTLSNSQLYFHALPGRLRIEIPALRSRPGIACRIRQAIGAIPGVRRTEVSICTRRVLIEYDPDLVDQAVITGRLRLMGCFYEGTPSPVRAVQAARCIRPRLEVRRTEAAAALVHPSLSGLPGARRHITHCLIHVLAEILAKCLVEAALALLV